MRPRLMSEFWDRGRSRCYLDFVCLLLLCDNAIIGELVGGIVLFFSHVRCRLNHPLPYQFTAIERMKINFSSSKSHAFIKQMKDRARIIHSFKWCLLWSGLLERLRLWEPGCKSSAESLPTVQGLAWCFRIKASFRASWAESKNRPFIKWEMLWIGSL